jgi:hypothetical protein
MPLPDAFFGSTQAGDMNWRAEDLQDMEPDDDSELPETPQDVIDMLGFDPLDE